MGVSWVSRSATLPDDEETGDNWQSVKVAFTARSDNSRLMVGMWGASGTLAIDDVRINAMEKQEDAVLDNPDLEPFGSVGPAPFDWTVDLNGGTATTVDDDIRSGSGALELARTGSGTTKCTQTIDINGLTRYWGYIYIYTDDVGAGGADFTIKQGNTALFESDSYTGDNGWDRIEFDFTTEDDGASLTFELALKDTGTARFDELLFRRMPLMAADFEDTAWQSYWTKEGNGNWSREYESGNYYLKVNHETSYLTTTVYQEFPAIEGLPYMISGKIKADATPNEEGDGAYIRLYDNDLEEVVAQVGPYTDEDEWVDWAFDLQPDPIASPSTERYKLQFVLEDAAGWAGLDSMNLKCAPVMEFITVLPQPCIIDKVGGYIGDIGGTDTWKIVAEYTTENEDTDAGYRNLMDLYRDLTWGDGTNQDFYFDIDGAKLQTMKLADFNPLNENHYPAIVIGSPYNQKIIGLAEKRGIDPEDVVVCGGDGYVLDTSNNKGIRLALIMSTGGSGRYYGVQTFLQLIINRGEPPYGIPEVTIYDWPAMKIRGAHIVYPLEYKLDPSNENWKPYQYKVTNLLPRNDQDGNKPTDVRAPLEVYVRFLSRLKINSLLIQSPIFYCLNEDSGHNVDGEPGNETNLEIIEPFFKYCRKYYIEPIPVMQSLGYAKFILQFTTEIPGDSNFPMAQGVEGCWVGGTKESGDPVPLPQVPEAFEFKEEEENSNVHILDNPLVIRTPDRPIKVLRDNSPGEPIELAEGTDYTLEYKELEFDMVDGFDRTEEVTDGGANKNAKVTLSGSDYGWYYVTYNFVNEPSSGWDSNYYSYCPSESIVQDFMEEKIEEVVEGLEAEHINFGHDEPQQMHTCSLCNKVTATWPLTHNGKLFGEDVNRLRGYFVDAWGGEYKTSYRPMLYADHVSYTHEQEKGFPMETTNYGGEGGKVCTCSLIINDDVIMGAWYYKMENEPEYEDWYKYKMISDLTDAGFDVYGGSAGYAKKVAGAMTLTREAHVGGNPHIFFEPHKDKGKEEYNGKDYWASFIDLEGTYEENLYPMNKTCHVDDNGLAWFARRESLDGYHKTDLKYDYDDAEFWCSFRGFSSVGTLWLDDVSLDWAASETGTYTPLVTNGDFETLGSGNTLFQNWDNTSRMGQGTGCAADDEIHRDYGDDGDTYSLRIRRKSLTSEVFDAAVIQDLNKTGGFNVGEWYRIRGYLRTRELDTLRMVCPKQWITCGQDFAHVTPEKGTYVGGINYAWAGGICLPHEDNLRIKWKYQVGTIAAAEWNWTCKFPPRPLLMDVWFKPFMMLEKEVTW